MTDPAVLKRLGAISQSLNEASDTISKRIIELEGVLSALRLGVWAWVEISRDDEYEEVNGSLQRFTRVRSLGYGKHKNEWALLVVDHLDEFDVEDRDVALLREAKRELKLEAVEKIPELLKEIEARAAKVAADATERAGEISDLARALREHSGVTSGRTGGRPGK